MSSFSDYQNDVPAEASAPVNRSGRANIKVIGVGGAGNNAVNRMIAAGITSAEFYVVNTDAQALASSPCENRIQIGIKLTNGLGAGADPEVGRAAAEENKDDLTEAVKGTDLLFITAGMGGGTGTGAAPVIAKIARDMKILTVAVVTEPFDFEGRKRRENTVNGLDNLKKYVDTLIIIPNDKIKTVVDKNTPFTEAMRVADDILKQGIKGLAELIVNPSLINLDFADVKTILKDKGLAHLGVGVAKGDNRIIEAVRYAVNSPLLETTVEGASGIIINVVGGEDLTFDEVTNAVQLIGDVVDSSANIIFGARIDPNVHDEVEITVIATGFGSKAKQQQDDRAAAQARQQQMGVTSPYYNRPQAPQGPQAPQAPQGYTQAGYAPQPQPQPQPQQAPQYPQSGYAQTPQAPQGYPQGYAQNAQPQPQPLPQQEPQGGIERRSEKKVPKFVQAIREWGKNGDDKQ